MLSYQCSQAIVVSLLLGAIAPAEHSHSERPGDRQSFRSGVDVISVTVVARDSAGRLIPDLSADDFSVLDGGAVQTLVGFERISIPTAAPLTTAAPAGSYTTPPIRDVTTNETLEDGRVFVLVLDALHVAAGRNLDVRAYTQQFIAQHVGPNDLVAIMSPGADASATQDFTNDKSRLIAAIDKFTGTKLKSATQELTEFTHFGARQPDPSDAERAGRVYTLTDTLRNIAAHLDRIEGRRKALLLFSEGIDYDINDVTGKQQRYASEVARAMAEAIGALARTNVVMYTIDPRSLTSVQNDLLEHPIFDRSPGSEESLSERDFEREVTNSIHSLRDLAQATGGFLASDRGLTRAFDQIVEEESHYYVPRYTPSAPPSKGEFRKISVRVSRPGVRLTARHGYVLPKPDAGAQPRPPVNEDIPQPIGAGRGASPRPRFGADPLAATATGAKGPSEELSTLLASALPKAGLSIRVQAVPLRGGGKKADVQLVVEVLGGGLQFVVVNGRSEERLELALVTVDERGRVANGRSTTIESPDFHWKSWRECEPRACDGSQSWSWRPDFIRYGLRFGQSAPAHPVW